MKRQFFYLIFIIPLLFVSCKDKKNPQGGKPDKKNGDEVSLTEVKYRKIENYLDENGEIKPESVIKVKFNFTGKVTRLYKEEGDRCVAGENLALVSPDISQIRSFTSAQITYQRALTSLEKLSNELEETKELYSQFLVSRQSYENALNDYRIAEAEVVKARLELQSLQETGSIKGGNPVPVKAPNSGTIVNRYVDIGDYIIASSTYQSGSVLFEIADITKLIIEAKINEMDILNVQPDATVTLIIEALPEKSFTGKVFRIFPTPVLVDNVKKYTIQIAPSSEFPSNIKPGMSVRIKILTVHKENILTVGIGSVVRDSEKKKDFVLIPNGEMFKRLYITTGARDNDNIEILEGLKEGDKVVKNPYRIPPEKISPDEKKEDSGEKKAQPDKKSRKPQKEKTN